MIYTNSSNPQSNIENQKNKNIPAPSRRPGEIGRDCLYLAAAIILIPWFLWRRFVRRKQSAGLQARLGFVPERPANVPRVWIHAVSVGEAVAAQTLLTALRRRWPRLDIVVSTTTVTGQRVAAKNYGADKVFYYPFDLSGAVKRALDRVRPSLLVLMELEVWPNMLAAAARRNIPVLVVNGRITARSAARYRRFWFLVGRSFQDVRWWLAQSEEYAARFKALGLDPQRITLAGNLKYDAIDTAPAGADERRRLRETLGISADAQVLIGGSTHPSEEAALLAAYTHLRRGASPDLRLILVPRHPERIKAVLDDIAAAGFTALRRSEMIGAEERKAENTAPPSPSPPPVLVIDTVGELKAMYKTADVAFVGGSLIPHGGQNVMEPCGLGVPVIHGPYMHNFNDALEILRACRGAREVTRETLAAAVEQLLRNPKESAAMAARARAGFIQAQGATARAVEYIAALSGTFNF